MRARTIEQGDQEPGRTGWKRQLSNGAVRCWDTTSCGDTRKLQGHQTVPSRIVGTLEAQAALQTMLGSVQRGSYVPLGSSGMLSAERDKKSLLRFIVVTPSGNARAPVLQNWATSSHPHSPEPWLFVRCLGNSVPAPGW